MRSSSKRSLAPAECAGQASHGAVLACSLRSVPSPSQPRLRPGRCRSCSVRGRCNEDRRDQHPSGALAALLSSVRTLRRIPFASCELRWSCRIHAGGCNRRRLRPCVARYRILSRCACAPEAAQPDCRGFSSSKTRACAPAEPQCEAVLNPELISAASASSTMAGSYIVGQRGPDITLSPDKAFALIDGNKVRLEQRPFLELPLKS